MKLFRSVLALAIVGGFALCALSNVSEVSAQPKGKGVFGKVKSTTLNAEGVGTITVSVSDPTHKVSLPAFRVNVTAPTPPPAQVNEPPTITGTPATTATVGQTYTFTPVGDDPNDDTLTFAISNKPSWATFSTANGSLTGTPTFCRKRRSARVESGSSVRGVRKAMTTRPASAATIATRRGVITTGAPESSPHADVGCRAPRACRRRTRHVRTCRSPGRCVGRARV